MIELTFLQLIGVIALSLFSGLALIGVGVLIAVAGANAILDEMIEKKKAMKSEEN